MTRLFLHSLLALAILGCTTSGGGGGGDTLASDATMTATDVGTSLGDDTAGCEPGSPGCPCANGMCLAPLVCVMDHCTWPGPSGTDGDPDTGGESSTGEPLPCASIDDCDSEEVCMPDGACRYAPLAPYKVTITDWVPVNCSGGTFDGAADLWWSMLLAGEQVGSSGWVQGGCPGHWSTTPCIEEGGFLGPFVLGLYDEDNTASELFDELWFDYGDGGPGSFPAQYLVDGIYDGPTNNGGSVTIEFELVEQCG